MSQYFYGFHISRVCGPSYRMIYELLTKEKKESFLHETSFIPGESCVKNWRRLEKSNFLAQVCEMFFI